MHEICQISWNPLNFMKSAGFHGLPLKCCIFHQNQYRYISPCHEIWRISWSTTKMLYFSSEPIQIYKSLPWNLADFMAMKSTRFHEIRQISWNLSWNLPNFMKSTGFHEIHHEIRRISCISQMSQGPMVLFFYIGVVIRRQQNWFIFAYCWGFVIKIFQLLVYKCSYTFILPHKTFIYN